MMKRRAGISEFIKQVNENQNTESFIFVKLDKI